MQFSFNQKSLFLSAIFLCSLAGSSVNAGFYDIANAVGDVTDLIAAKGKLSKKNQVIFDEMAKKIDIDNRNIQVRNSGLLMRLGVGYNFSAYEPFTNRVYVNESFLNELTTEQKKFVFAQALIAAKNNHAFKKLALAYAADYTNGFARDLAVRNGLLNRVHVIVRNIDNQDQILEEYDDYPNNNVIKQYLAVGIYNRFGIRLSLANLITAQINQAYDKEANIDAIKIAGIKPEEAIACIEKMYHPDTDKWPAYAKIQNVIIQLRFALMSLPILKQHAHDLVSSDDCKDDIDTAAHEMEVNA